MARAKGPLYEIFFVSTPVTALNFPSMNSAHFSSVAVKVGMESAAVRVTEAEEGNHAFPVESKFITVEILSASTETKRTDPIPFSTLALSGIAFHSLTNFFDHSLLKSPLYIAIVFGLSPDVSGFGDCPKATVEISMNKIIMCDRSFMRVVSFM